MPSDTETSVAYNANTIAFVQLSRIWGRYAISIQIRPSSSDDAAYWVEIPFDILDNETPQNLSELIEALHSFMKKRDQNAWDALHADLLEFDVVHDDEVEWEAALATFYRSQNDLMRLAAARDRKRRGDS